MSIWVTPEGFSHRTLQEIRLGLEQGFQVIFGTGVDLSPEGPNGQLISLMALAIANIDEGGEEIYASNDPAMATGTALDKICALSGISRIQAGAAVADVLLYVEKASLGTMVPSGRQVRRTRGGVLFSLQDSVTIQTSACRDIYLKHASLPAPGGTITLVSTLGTFTQTVLSTEILTYQALAVQINALFPGTASSYTTPTAGSGAQYATGPLIRILTTDSDTGFTLGSDWDALLTGSNGSFTCDVVGAETAAPGEISEIVIPVSGWTRTYNQISAIPGRATESDAQLRIRRQASFRLGYATEESIRNRLLNDVTGIIDVTVTSNRSMEEDADGRPPKSFEVIVDGGADQDILDKIWESMPAGIYPHGNIEGEVIDSQGIPQTVRFTRPVDKYLWIRITYAVYDEEVFPVDGEAQIRSAILAWAPTEYLLGRDIIPQRIAVPIYTIPGIGEITIEVAITSTSGGTPSYVDTVIEVGGRDRAIADAARIIVTEA